MSNKYDPDALSRLNLSPERHPVLYEGRIDDTRLTRGEDVLLAGYPRGGTNWIALTVALMMGGEAEYEQIWKKPLERVLYMEYTEEGSSRAGVEERASQDTPRLCRTCLPYNFINRWVEEDKVKTILVTRNPKDILVDMYDVYKATKGLDYSGTWNEFFEFATTEGLMYGNHYDWVSGWNENHSKGDILFLQVEDPHIYDSVDHLQRIAKFLDLDVSDEFCERIVKDSNLENLKKATANLHPLNKMGGGLNGTFEWQRWFTVGQNEWFDEKYKELYGALEIPIEYES